MIWKSAIAVLLCIAGLAFSLLSFDSFLFFGLPLIAGVTVAVVNSWCDPARSTAEQGGDLLRIYMGGHLLWSCIRYWSTDMQPAIDHPIGGPFVESLVAMNAFPAIKTLEGVCGVLLLGSRYVPLALVLALPTSVTIFYLNTFVTARLSGVLTGPPELAVNLLLMLVYFPALPPNADHESSGRAARNGRELEASANSRTREVLATLLPPQRRDQDDIDRGI